MSDPTGSLLLETLAWLSPIGVGVVVGCLVRARTVILVFAALLAAIVVMFALAALLGLRTIAFVAGLGFVVVVSIGGFAAIGVLIGAFLRRPRAHAPAVSRRPAEPAKGTPRASCALPPPGARCVVVRPFRDDDGRVHACGETFTLLGASFAPRDDRLTLFIESGDGRRATLRCRGGSGVDAIGCCGDAPSTGA